ncbi:MAG: sulfite exporter TauE/SafE family protein [Bacteroidota bacterium]
MSNYYLAFLLGLISSLHCAVMCGPLMLSLPLQKKDHLNNVLQLLLYQFGRILVYTIFGILAGLIGSSITLLSSQQTLSLIVGILLLVFTIIVFSGKYIRAFTTFQNRIISPISKLMGKVYGLSFWGFFAGMLNGLIPCGMIYLALAAALNSTDILSAGKFMFLFGLGTTPLMLFISVGGIYLRRYIHFNSKKMIPWFMLFLGLLFVLRSANFGIPFLSPTSHLHGKQPVAECK